MLRRGRHVLSFCSSEASIPICRKLELVVWRSCVKSHSCQLTGRAYAHCSQVDRRSDAIIQRCEAGRRLPQAIDFPRMPQPNNLVVVLTNLHGQEDTPPQKQRHGSLAATCIPPTQETAALGHRVEHLSAMQDGHLVCTICQQLQLPEVGSHQHTPCV